MAAARARRRAKVTLTTAVDDGVERRVDGLPVVAYDIPEGCIAGYYPECNPLIPLWHYAEGARSRRRNRSPCTSGRLWRPQLRLPASGSLGDFDRHGLNLARSWLWGIAAGRVG